MINDEYFGLFSDSFVLRMFSTFHFLEIRGRLLTASSAASPLLFFDLRLPVDDAFDGGVRSTSQ